MLITENQKRLIVESGISLVGQTRLGVNCADFVKKIYAMADIEINFFDCPRLSFEEIKKAEVVGCLIFLHRKKTKLQKRITHIGIIFPDNKILHYSRWMNGGQNYEVFLSSIEDVLEIYDFVEP